MKHGYCNTIVGRDELNSNAWCFKDSIRVQSVFHPWLNQSNEQKHFQDPGALEVAANSPRQNSGVSGPVAGNKSSNGHASHLGILPQCCLPTRTNRA